MSRIIGLFVSVVVVIAVLGYFGFIQLSPEGEQALDQAQDSVGEALESTGEAISDANATN